MARMGLSGQETCLPKNLAIFGFESRLLSLRRDLSNLPCFSRRFKIQTTGDPWLLSSVRAHEPFPTKTLQGVKQMILLTPDLHLN